MQGLLIFGSIALLGGILVAAQGPIYARLSEGLGRDYLLAVFVAFLSATFATAVLAALNGSFRSLSFEALRALPFWVWFGGLFGAMHVAISMQSIPILGVTLFLVVVVTGNLIGAAIFDHFGIFGLKERPFTWSKALGLGIVILGVAILVKDQKN